MSVQAFERVAERSPAIGLQYRGPGRGWWVVGPGVVAGVEQLVNVAGPFTTREAANRRASFELGRADTRRLGLRAVEYRDARYLARVSETVVDRAYWLGVAWQGSRHEFVAGRIGGPGWSVKA